MTRKLSSHDYELLSAYLDGELPGRDRDKVEARLKSQPDWRAGLEELQFSRRMLRSLPHRRAPRNFTLKPSMVPARSRSRAFPILRLASAVASILLVITFASDLALNLSARSLPMSAAPAANSPAALATQVLPTEIAGFKGAPPAVPAAPEATTAADQSQRSMTAAQPTEEPTSQALTAQAEAPLGLGAGPGPMTETPTAEPAMGIAIAPTETPTSEAAMSGLAMTDTPTPLAGSGGGCAEFCQSETPVPQGTPSLLGVAPGETETPSPEAALETSPNGSPAVTLNPQVAPPRTTEPAPLGQAPLAPQPGSTLEPAPTQPPAPVVAQSYEPALRTLEAFFAAIALITGIAALIYRSRLSG